MGVIYLDACVVISAIEDEGPFGIRTRALIAAFGDRPAAISPLVIHECLVGPMRTANDALRVEFDRLFAAMNVLRLDLPEFLRAAELRAANPGLRTPDALHLAAAELAGCEALWTNDKRLTAASNGLAIDITRDF